MNERKKKRKKSERERKKEKVRKNPRVGDAVMEIKKKKGRENQTRESRGLRVHMVVYVCVHTLDRATC